MNPLSLKNANHSKSFIINLQQELNELNSSKKPGKNSSEVKVQNVFLLVKKDSVRTIEKHSFYGVWLALKQKVAKFFHQDSELSESKKKLIELITTLNTSHFDSANLSLFHEIGDALHIDMTQIAQEALRELKFESSHCLKGPSVSEEKSSSDLIKKVNEDLIQLKKILVELALFKDDEQEKILKFLKTYENTPQLLNAWADSDGKQFSQLLYFAILKAAELAPDEEFDSFEKILDTLSMIHAGQNQSIPSTSITPTINNLALVLGDSFIEKSGLEGDINSITYAKFIVDYLKSKGNTSSEAERLCYTLEHTLDFRDSLSSESLRTKIKETLDHCPEGPNGEKRCLFFGGWVGHAVVFEMEKKANGRFAFRVYNQGEGVNAHEKIEVGLKTKYSCFYSIDDIDEKVVLKRSFLASLQKLTTFEAGQDILYDQILPTLGNKREAMDGSFQTFIQIQRAGTCVYRSLQSFIARSLNQNDYPIFKFEYKLFMLKKYLPELRKLAANMSKSDEEYRNRVLDYNLVSKMVQKFSDEIQKNSDKIDPQDLLDAKTQLANYNVLLKRIEKNLYELETETISTGAKMSLIDIRTNRTSVQPLVIAKTNTLELSSANLTRTARFYLNEIQNFQKPLTFYQINLMISRITAMDSPTAEVTLVLDSLFKAIGSVKDFENISNDPLEDPKRNQEQQSFLLTNLYLLLSRLEKLEVDVEKKATLSLATYYLAECVSKKLPSNEGVLLGNYSFLSSMNLSNIERVVYLDPYWSDFMDDLKKKERDPSIIAYSVPSHFNNYDMRYSLSAHMVTSIMNYWNKLPPAFLEKVNESIAQDRANQKITIEREEKRLAADIEVIRMKVQSLQAQLSDVLQQVKTSHIDKSSLEAEIESHNKRMRELQKGKAAVRSQVENDPEYWPKAWEDALSDEAKATFIFANEAFFNQKMKVPEILPKTFRDFFTCATKAAHIFHPNLNYGITYVKKPDMLPSLNVKSQFGSAFSPWSISTILPSFDKSWKPYFEEIGNASKEIENNVPFITREIFSKTSGDQVISTEEMREILAFNPKDIRIESLIVYFEENSEKLEDENWLLILYSSLFESHILLDALRDPSQPKVKEKIEAFFDVLQKKAISTNNFKFIGNLMMLKGTFRRYLNHLDPGRSVNADVQEVQSILEKALKDEFKSQWPVLFQGLAAYCSQLPLHAISQSENMDILILVNALSMQYSPSDFSHREVRSQLAANLQQNIKEFFTCFEVSAHEIFLPRSIALLKTAFPWMETFTQDQQADCLNIKTASGEANFCLSSGMIITNDHLMIQKYHLKPSQTILDELVNIGLFTKNETQTLRCQEEPPYTYIKDLQTGLVIIKSGSGYYCEIKTNPNTKEWMKYVPKSSSETPAPELSSRETPNLELNERYHHFNSGFDTYICDKKTLECLYVISNPSSPQASRHVKDVQTGFELADSKLFANFEDSSCSLFWVNENKTLQKIEFPRMNLSFKRDQKGIMQCAEKPGWFISEKQFAPHMGKPTGFLTLEDKEGRKKILLPAFDSEATVVQDALNFPFAYDFTTKERSVRYLECELKENHLIPPTLEARYQLAYVYLEKGFTQLAEELLFSNQAEVTSRGLTKEERTILERMVFSPKSKEVSGQKIRIRLHALYLLENDGLTHAEGLSAPLDKAVVRERQKVKEKIIEEYLTRLGHIKPLEEREERLILKNLVTSSDSDIIEMRLKEFGFLKEVDPYGGEKQQIQELKIVAKNKPHFVKYKPGTSLSSLEGINPGFAVRFQYYLARLSNTFPFDYSDKDELKRGIEKFGYCIVREAESTKSLESAKNNGLLSFCSFLTFHFEDLNKELLRRIFDPINNLDEKTMGTKPMLASQVIPQSSKKNHLGNIEREIAQLNALAFIQPSEDESSFLPTQSALYLQKTQVKAQIPQSKLFAENTPEITDRARNIQFAAMREDLAKAGELLNHEWVYTQNKELNFDTLITTLESRFKVEHQKLAEQEQLLLSATHSALTSQLTSEFQFRTGKRKLPLIQELCVLCSKIDGDASIKKLYPELSDTAIKNLRASIQAYLIQKQFVQHLGRAKQQAQHIEAEKDNSSKQILFNELGKSLEASRCYTPDDPLAMVFLSIETILNIKLREDQISNIKDFYVAQQGGEELVVQMIMGAGKTSVIQPILAFLFAKPELLSTVMVPASLFHAVNEELSKLLGSSFDLFVFSNPLNKKLAQIPEYLHTYLDRLEEAQSRGCTVLLTPQDKYTIYSSLKEAYYLNDKVRAELLTKICHLLQVKELAQIDEIDMVMDPSIIYKFPLGEKTPIDGMRAEAVTKLLMSLINDKEFSDEIALDFITQLKKRQDPSYVPKGNELSEDLYQTKVAPKLAEIAFNQFMDKIKKDGITPSDSIRENVKSFLSKTTPFDSALHLLPQGDEAKITDQLSSMTLAQLQELSQKEPSSPQSLVASKLVFINQRDTNIKGFFTPVNRDYLGVLSKSINKILKSSLFEEGGVHYSNDPEKGIYTARPYYAPNSPKTSVPSDPYEMLIKSIQNVFYNGIPREAVEKIFASWQKTAGQESNQFHIDIHDTDAYKKFKEIIGAEAAKNIRFIEKPPQKEMLDLLEKKMNQDPRLIEDFVKKYIIKQVGFYSKSIETTPQTLAGLSFKAFGYTGTINEGILSLSMKGKPEIGTDGKTIQVVDRKIASESSQIREFDASKASYPHQIIQQFKEDPNFYVLTDSGNWLKEEQLSPWVEKLLKEVSQERKNIQGVIYPSITGEWLSMEYENGELVSIPLRNSKLKPDQRLTIIPSKHETGTNIHQIPTAKVLNTVRKNMTLRDALQSIFRMRQILQGQQIVLGISKETKDHIVTLLIQDIMQNDPYRTYLNEFLASGAQPVWGDAPIDKWLKDVFSHVKESRTFGDILSVGCALFKLSDHSETLWNYLLKNQIEDKLSKNILSLDHQLSEVLEKPIRMVLNDPSVPYDERKALFHAMGTFFTPEQKDSPFEEMIKSGQKIPIDQAIEQKIQRLMQFYFQLQQSPSLERVQKNIAILYGKGNPEEVLQETFKKCVKKDILPEYLAGEGNVAEIEQEQEVEQEVNIEAKILMATEPQTFQRYDYKSLVNPDSVNAVEGYHPTEFENAKFSKIIDMLSTEASKVRQMIGEFPLEFSPNLFLDKSLKSSYLLPSNYLLMVKTSNGGYRYVLVSHEDAAKIHKGMLKHKNAEGNACALISFGLGKKVVSTFDHVNMNQAELDKAILFSKLLSGKVHYKKEEMELFKKIINKSDDPKELLLEIKTLLENILRFKPTSAHEYENSYIKKYIYDMLNKEMVKTQVAP